MYGTMMTGRPDFEHRGLRECCHRARCVRLGLIDNGQVEAPCDLAELFAGPGKARVHHGRLGGHRARHWRGKPGHGGLGCRFAVVPLIVDYLDGK